MTDERGTGGSNAALVKRRDSADLDLVNNVGEFPRNLEDRRNAIENESTMTFDCEIKKGHRMKERTTTLTCIVVFTVSTGIRKIRNSAAAVLAATVLMPTLMSLVASMESRRVSTPVLAAVSPKRDIGPWIRAGATPR